MGSSSSQNDGQTLQGRRRFLTGALAGGLIAAGGGAALAQDKKAAAESIVKSNPKNLPPNVPAWSQTLGDGVAAHPYGMPSKYEKHVIRRDVEWLTVSRESSVNFTPLPELEGIITPNGLCFERHHAGAAARHPIRFQCRLERAAQSL